MSATPIWLAASVALLALAACGQKPETLQAGGRPATEAPEGGPAVKVNLGEPVDGDVTLAAPGSAVAGSEIALAFTGPANKGDYIDIVPRGYTQTSGELVYIYIPAAASGQKLRVLTSPGDYDVRYVLDLKGDRRVKAVQPLSVTAATATLKTPVSAAGAEPLSVEWSGPAGAGDYIDVVSKGQAEASGEIAYAYTSGGNPAKFTAPGNAGDYEIRYVLEGPGGRKVLATAPLTVTPAAATLTAPASAAKGAQLVIEYVGPQRSGDYVDLVRAGHMPTSGELTYFYANATAASELTMPAEAGQYEIRYVMEAPGGRIVLAKRTIEVR